MAKKKTAPPTGAQVKPTKRKPTEETWENIAQEAISAAQEVECSLDEFAEGLNDIAVTISERAGMARDEANAVAKRGGHEL